MIGYIGDTIVYVLVKGDDELEPVRWEQIKIKDVKEGNYIQMYHLPSMSFCFYPAKIVSGQYSGVLSKTNAVITYCKDQKLFACKYLPGAKYPIINEKSIDEFEDDEILTTIEGWSYELNQDVIDGSIEDMFEHMSHREKSHYCYKKVEKLEIEEEEYKGELYNIIAPIEYGLRIDEYGIGTIIHE